MTAIDETPRDQSGGCQEGGQGGAAAAEDLDRRIAAAAMGIAAEKGWRHTGLVATAKAAGLPLSTVYQRYSDRAALLAAVSRTADRVVLADETPADGEESARDRLFDVMMRRFDALRPYRDGLRSVVRDLPREPVTALAYSCRFGASMAWMLRAAGIEVERLGGALTTAGLGAVQARVMKVFLDDDSADLARTMAALDGELKRAERWAGVLRPCGKRASRNPAPPSPVEGVAG